MSESRLPTRACSIPAPSASRQTSRSRCASGEISPTGSVTALSATSPSSVTPRSSEIRSPSRARYVVGDPVHDHRVRRDAERGREALVALRGRVAALRLDVLVGDAVELAHLDARARDARRRARASRRAARPRAPSPRSRPRTCGRSRTRPRPSSAAGPRRARPRSRGRPPRRCGRRGCRRRSPGASGSSRRAAPSRARRARAAARITSGVSSERSSSAARRSIRCSSTSRSGTWKSKHDVDLAAELAEELVERLGLRHRAREAVEDEAADRVAAREPVADQADHQLVGDEVAAVVDRLELPPEVGRQLLHLADACRRVAMCGIPYIALIRCACVPLPDPCGPRTRMFSAASYRRKPS